MNKSTYIYSLEYPKGNIRYIGKSNNPKKRLNNHLAGALKRKRITYNNNWLFNLLSNGKSPILNIVDEVLIEEWEFWETYYIALYKSWGFELNNLTTGGLNKVLMGTYIKKKISDSNMRRVFSEEHRKNISESRKGIVPWNKGVSRPEETKRKISEANKGKKAYNKGIPISEETRKKLSEINSGSSNPRYKILHTEETKKKMSDLKLGDKNPFYGRKHSDETKIKIAETSRCRFHSEESKRKMSELKKGKKQKIVSCPYCDKVGGISGMKRFHFDNCKFKNL